MAHNQYELLKQRRFLPFFGTQAFGAFNDNVYRQAIIGLLFAMGISTAERSLYATLAPAIFILPYFLFSAYAGQIADKLEKSKLIRITTTMEIVLMSVAALGFYFKSLPLLLVCLFATGVQSTLFGPVKYSLLPAVLRKEELTGGNGLVEMGTTISILLGMMVGGLVFRLAGDNGHIVAGALIITLAICGNMVARQIPYAAPGDPSLKVNWNPIPESRYCLSLTRKQLAVRNSVLGISWFWFFGTMVTSQLPAFAEVFLGGDERLYILMLALFSIGTGVGSLLCERLSGRVIEIGLVPFGAIGMTVFLLDLVWQTYHPATVHGVGFHAFLTNSANWRIIADIILIGVFTGFYVVPLFALVQARSPSNEISRVFAGINIQNSGFVVLASVLAIALQMTLLKIGDFTMPMPGLTVTQLFLALAIFNALVALLIFSIVPEFLMRFLSWIMVRALYRVRVHGVHDNIPEEGPALIVCNHVSYMDALILSASIPRPVRFVMYYKIFDIPVMRWIFATAKAIPIAGARENPDIMREAFEEVEDALRDGQLVCIFPEGALTKDGEIAPFKSGVEKILAACPVPVVPMALRNMWGSMWSRRDSRLRRARVPRRFRAPIEVIAGPALPPSSSAEQMQDVVQALRGDQA